MELTIVMINGERWINNPELGLNLDTVEGIKECLLNAGYYELTTESGNWKRIYVNDVEEILQ